MAGNSAPYFSRTRAVCVCISFPRPLHLHSQCHQSSLSIVLHLQQSVFENLHNFMASCQVETSFRPVGTLCYLVGLKDPEHAASGPMGGAILETAVLSEIVRTLTHRGIDPQVYFWRTTAGTEVDFLVHTGAGIVPIEVKLSATPRPAMASAIRKFQRDRKGGSKPGYVVHPGDVRLPLGPSVTAVPFADL